MIPELEETLWFPDPRQAWKGEPADGLVAVGGDLSPERLALAYRSGIFPWTIDPITWWSPDPRAIIPLNSLHVSRSLTKVLRRGRFAITQNQAFREVMHGCAEPRNDGEETWIGDEFIEAYCALHRQGLAHSVEVWQETRLVGGIYGVAIGGLFAGESMFHCVDSASKVALVTLVDRLRLKGFQLFDIQMLTPITEQMGAIEIPREDYLARLARAVTNPETANLR